MLLGIAILLAAISFHLFNEGEWGILITIIGIIVVILGYSSKDVIKKRRLRIFQRSFLLLQKIIYSDFELMITIISPMIPNKAPIHHKKVSAGTANIKPNSKNAKPTFCLFIVSHLLTHYVYYN